ncbi:hypothetical protein D3C85_1118580 [compost metagenome]
MTDEGSRDACRRAAFILPPAPPHPSPSGPPSPTRGEGNSARIPPRQSPKISGVGRRQPPSARLTLDLPHPSLVPSQGRARSAGEPKRRRERREWGSCRAVRPTSRAPGKGAPSGRWRRIGRAVQDASRAMKRGERLACRSVVSSSSKGDRPQHHAKTSMGPGDGAFDPPAREVSVRVAGGYADRSRTARRCSLPVMGAGGSRKERRLPRAHV